MRPLPLRVAHLPPQVSYLSAVSVFLKQNQVMSVQTYGSQTLLTNVLYYEHDASATMMVFL